jgi:hypothetical protein
MRDYSNYHNVDMKTKITHDGLHLLQRSLNGFEGYDVVINGQESTKVLIYQKWDSSSETKKVIGQISDIERGYLLEHDGMKWLITTLPEDNKIYRKAEMQLCNSTLPIQSGKTRVLKGYDKDGRPVYKEDYTVNKLEPCIAETKFPSRDGNEQLPLPEGNINITLKYQVADNIQPNKQFSMYGNTYKITGVDYTKVINDKGIMIVSAERIPEGVVKA